MFQSCVPAAVQSRKTAFQAFRLACYCVVKRKVCPTIGVDLHIARPPSLQSWGYLQDLQILQRVKALLRWITAIYKSSLWLSKLKLKTWKRSALAVTCLLMRPLRPDSLDCYLACTHSALSVYWKLMITWKLSLKIRWNEDLVPDILVEVDNNLPQDLPVHLETWIFWDIFCVLFVSMEHLWWSEAEIVLKTGFLWIL